MKTFLFYDVETSGLSPAFDQILTFACIRTNPSLVEIDRRSITIKLRRDIVPSPHAFITHCLSLEELKQGMDEYHAALAIHDIFNTPDTISIGYNSLGFDDEFMRFLFYRNLLDPYSHQYAKGCSRMDILPVTALFKIFCPQALKWPCLEDGRASLKLELISRENRFVTSGKSHEAMADVEALIELSKAFAVQQKVWNYALDFFDKEKDSQRISRIDQGCNIGGKAFRVCLMVSASFGPAVNYLAPVINIGESIAYKNQSLWLRLDREEMFTKNEESGLFDWYVSRKRPADELIVLPCLDRFWNRLSKASQKTARKNIANMQNHSDLVCDTIQHHIEFKYPVVPDIDPDADLYQSGFFSFAEKKEIQKFHSMDDPGKASVCNLFNTPRIKQLARRILARNFENLIDSPIFPEFEDHFRQLKSSRPEDQVKGYKNDIKYGKNQALADLNEIEAKIESLDLTQQQIFFQIKRYIENL